MHELEVPSLTERYTKRRSLARPGNLNAKKRPVWRFDYLDPTNPASCTRFLVELVKATYTGEIGTRQAGCINNSLRIILSYHLDASSQSQSTTMTESQTPQRVSVKIIPTTKTAKQWMDEDLKTQGVIVLKPSGKTMKEIIDEDLASR